MALLAPDGEGGIDTTETGADLFVPAGPEDLTPGWLTSALRSRSPETQAVSAVHCDEVGPGLGFTGQVFRLRLAYEGPSNAAPDRLIAKLAAPPGSARGLMNEFGGYEREVRFYTGFAADAGLPVPACYYAATDGKDGTCAILLEDLKPARVGDQVAGATPDEAMFVVETLARFHARWWNDQSLLGQPWLMPSRAIGERLPELFQQGLTPIREQLGDRYPDVFDLLRRIEKIVPALASEFATRMPPRPFTLTHGDVRLDNLLFPSQEGGRFAVLDWQGVSVGSPANELAYWLILSVPAEVRRQHEPALLARYHSVLRDNGVKDYTLRRLRREYAAGLLVQLVGLPVIGANLDFTSERGQALSTAVLDRVSAAARDLKAARTIRLLSMVLWLQRAFAWMRAPLRRGTARS